MSDQKNRVAMFYGPRNLRIVEMKMPKTGPEDVLIKVKYAGVCGSDLHAYTTPNFLPPNIVIGHEFSGEIAEVGEKVEGIYVGDRVTANPMLSFMGCGGSQGAFADYVPIKNAILGMNVFKLTDNISDEAGALIEPLCVAQHGVNRIDLKPTDKVAIFGAGPIGLSALAAVKAAGVEEVVVTDVIPARLEMAKRLGASDVFNPKEGKVLDYLIQRHGGDFYAPLQTYIPNTDTIIECAGIPQTFMNALACVRFGGQALVLASYVAEVSLNPTIFLSKEVKVIGSFWAPAEFQQVIDLMDSGKVDMTPMITTRFPLQDLAKALDHQLKTGEGIKLLAQM